MTDGVDLGGVSATVDADADVDVGKFVEADCEEGFVDLRSWVGVRILEFSWGEGWSEKYLEAEYLGLSEGKRFAVYFD